MVAQAAGAAVQLGAGGAAVDRDRGLGGVGRGRAAHGGDVVDQRPVGVVADRRDHRHAQQRDGPAQRLVAEREQVGQRAAAAGDDHDLDLLDRGQLAQRGGDPRRGVAVLDGRERPHQPPGPAAAAQPGEDVVAGLAPLAGDDADRPRQQRAGQPLLGLEQPVGVQPPAQALELHQQVALAGEPQLGDREAERRARRSRCPGSSHSRRRPRPASRRSADRRALEVVAPHRAGQRAAGVAQLEVDPRPGGAKAPHLADQLDARELRSRRLQLGGVGADRVRARGARCRGSGSLAAGELGASTAEATRRSGHAWAVSAARRSATRSAGSSIPQLRRTRSAGTAAASPRPTGGSSPAAPRSATRRRRATRPA